jgi:hypothetical protein
LGFLLWKAVEKERWRRVENVSSIPGFRLLRVLDELLECRDDDALHLIYTKLQNVIN